MLTTLELRWFSHGTPPTEVEHWFNTNSLGELLGPPEEREDLYLYIPQCDYLNLKLRQGNLEVKWRNAEFRDLQFAPLWKGNGEKWLKWSCQDPTQQSMMPVDGVEKGPWVGVKKARSQRLYQGIVFELTQLRVNNEAWWSIAFEMAGEPLHQMDRFKDAVSLVSQTYQGPELLAEHSYAYPHWLSRIV